MQTRGIPSKTHKKSALLHICINQLLMRKISVKPMEIIKNMIKTPSHIFCFPEKSRI